MSPVNAADYTLVWRGSALPGAVKVAESSRDEAMTLEWAAYDAFAWSKASQSPMDERQKTALAEWAADLLHVPAAERAAAWGKASPPGRYAATVIRLAPDVSHPFKAEAGRAQVEAVGLKLFKTTPDALKAARKAVEFHTREIGRLPGLPNPRVQRSIAAGLRPDGPGALRGYVVQEWVSGESLEDCLRLIWPDKPVDAAVVRSLIEQMIGGIVIPLWQAGTIWWDVRDANYCYCAERDMLRMIDVDSLDAYTDEILLRPTQWQARDKGRLTALARLRAMCGRLLAARKGAVKAKVEHGLREAWPLIEPALLRLGHDPVDGGAAARLALGRFIAALERSGLLGEGLRPELHP